MRSLSLFSGAGGGLIGEKLLGWEHIGYVEFNDYCQRVIKQRILDGYLDKAPIFGDIRAFIDSGCADLYRGVADVVTAGFPCQPFSVAGEQQAEDDPKNQWPATIEVIRRIRPKFALLENVTGLLALKYIRRIFGDLAESGYDAKWICLSAAELGAEHVRDRIWILAYPHGSQQQGRRVSGGTQSKHAYIGGSRWGKDKPGVDRASNGLACQMDRLAAIGNGQIPRVVRAAWEILND